jgi:hypothetical protein
VLLPLNSLDYAETKAAQPLRDSERVGRERRAGRDAVRSGPYTDSVEEHISRSTFVAASFEQSDSRLFRSLHRSALPM